MYFINIIIPNHLILIYLSPFLQVVKMMIVVVIIFGVCWLPQHVFFLVTNKNEALSRYVHVQHIYLVIYWLAMSNSMYNPIIYCWMNARWVLFAILTAIVTDSVWEVWEKDMNWQSRITECNTRMERLWSVQTTNEIIIQMEMKVSLTSHLNPLVSLIV